ncbi:hypothetical protein ONZ45_g12807 [Pleurotus djamor]|nr:hypothetical protein ONZ45_g12807 [Pleurotus djamor]
MPPKRKRAEDTKAAAATTTSTRATRSSARKTTATSATAPSVADAKNGAASPDPEPTPPVKKTKTTKAKAASSSKSKSAAKGKARKDDVSEDTAKSTNGTQPDAVKSTAPPTASAQKHEPYTSAKALATFKHYADQDDPDVIGPEGFSKLCEDAGIPMEGVKTLLMAWQMNTSEMGKITKEEWTKGTEKLKVASLDKLVIVVSDLDNLLIQGQPPLKRPAASKASHEPYDRSSYWQYASDTKTAFQSLYSFCFSFAKTPQSRNIEMEAPFWTVLLSPQYPIIEEIVQYINDKGSYKAVNKDLWSMTLDFCRTVQPDLTGYDADGAWPTLIDEFVAWKKESSTS